ncbi:biopolymer transporter ExbD [Leptolyngbya sp. FACHB-36]|uniref:ExbD/TolR family protein n=1 Tax=Leptolyngbya sp. FACHB-36 TaxID=2692808 RepID=UPI0016802C4C|nr:biopolymer transporter ExbD [Leptolyngbya sp. FACHB-36]MBD2019438.1 biopolymer transporter ExbD [Leptolyngbya sp. FACHB-36]
MKIHSDTPPEDVQIQIIPLIDVIFCILTFFILAALQLTRQQTINVDLPQAATGSAQTRDTLIVTISSTGQTFVEKQLVDRNQLYQLLEQYRQQNPNGLLVLNASKVAFYNDVVQVLDLMRSVGGDRVALATMPVEANQPAGASPAPTASPSNLFGNPNPSPPFNPTQPQIPSVGPTSGPVNPVPGSSPGPFGGTPLTPTNPAPSSNPSPTLP